MLGTHIIRKSITLVTVATVWCVYSMVAFALPADVTAEITVSGQVTVNGQPAVSNSTIVSGAVIVTAQNASAIVNFGKSGRMEIMGHSHVTVRFSENSIVAIITDGKTRITNPSGVAATVTAPKATYIADPSQANNFAVEVECSHSHVDTVSGLVTVREGSSETQVAAGSSASAGPLVQTGCVPCLRPDSGPSPSVGNWPLLVLLAAGIAGVGIFLGLNDDGNNFGGDGVVVSPTR